MLTAQKIADVMGGRAVFHREFATMRELDEMIVSGRTPRGALDALATRLSGEASFKFTIMPKATYSRHRRLPERHAQKAERLARVFALAFEVWENEDDARRFLTLPHPELGGDTPLDRAKSEIGAREVEEVIDRGRYGLPV